MKTENTLINTIKNSIPLALRTNNTSLVQRVLNDKAKEEGFLNWEYLCRANKNELFKIQQGNLFNNKTLKILDNYENDRIHNTILIENNLQLNHEILRQKVRNKDTTVVLADLKESDWSNFLNILSLEKPINKFNIISDNQSDIVIESQTIRKKETNSIFLTKYIHTQNIRDFILDIMDMSSVWSNKPILLFSSYWRAMSYKMNQKQSLEFQELKDMIQFNQYFSLYQELKNNQYCPKEIWLAMENFLKNLPQINLNTKEQKQVVYEQYGFIQMQIMRLINNLLAFENSVYHKHFNDLFNSQQITIFNIHAEEQNKKEFNLRLYLYLINLIYKNNHAEMIRKKRKITLNLINVLNEKAIDKLFYLNNNDISIIACAAKNEIHDLLKDNFQTIIK